MRKEGDKYIIEWNNEDEKDIVELITELAQLLEKGHTTIEFETQTVGDGNMEDGSDEFSWSEAKLVSIR